jgi:hypothetical protein
MLRGGVTVPPFLTSVLDGGEWSAALPPEKTALGIHWIEGWMGPRVVLDVMEKRKIEPLPEIKPRPSSP